jgi:hypothetical protein
MTVYWIYDLPNWLLGLLIVAVGTVGAVLGLLVTRPFTRKLLGASDRHNDVVSWVFAGVGVFYGLALGLIAVATWEDFSGCDAQVSKEAASLAALYDDLDGYPQPLRSKLESALRDYTRSIIEKDWPAHRKGEINEDGTKHLSRIEDEIMSFEPKSEREKIAHAEVIRGVSEVDEARRLRIVSVSTGLPAALWAVVLIGAGLSTAPLYLLWVENLRLHALLVALFSSFLALLIFLTAAMDNPFRGEFSVSPDVFQELVDRVMTPGNS